MKSLLVCLLMLAFVSCALARGPPRRGPPRLNNICDRESAAFQARHSMQIGTEQANRDQGALWRQQVAVIAQVPVAPDVLQWVQVVNFDFWQDNHWAADECAWNETQAWPRADPVTNEFVLAMQRTHVAPTRVYSRADFSTAPPTIEESQSEYTATWTRGSYVEESAIVINTDTYEYALGPKVVSAGWYDSNTGKLNYVNTLFNYVDHYYRTYTLNTLLEAVPGDQTTQYKVLADITSTSEMPPEIITAAFAWFDSVIDDDSFEPTINPNTGIGEYIFVPSQHLPAAKRVEAVAELPNTNAAVNIHSHASIQEAIGSFADSA